MKMGERYGHSVGERIEVKRKIRQYWNRHEWELEGGVTGNRNGNKGE